MLIATTLGGLYYMVFSRSNRLATHNDGIMLNEPFNLTSKQEKQAIDAANKGDAAAAYKLSLFYGLVLSKTHKEESVIWLKRAAKLGHVKAQYGLAVDYENGGFVTKDLTLARYWYEQAASQGDQHAVDRLKELFDK